MSISMRLAVVRVTDNEEIFHIEISNIASWTLVMDPVGRERYLDEHPDKRKELERAKDMIAESNGALEFRWVVI